MRELLPQPLADESRPTELAPFCVKQGSCRDRSRRTEHFRYAHGIARDQKRVPLPPYTLLAPLAEAGAREPLPSSLARRRKACLLAHSSRTAPRQPGSVRRVARSGF